MYLSQLLLDRMDRQAMRTLADVYRLHQFVMSGFAAYERPARILFRVEPEVRERAVQVIVQSHEPPDWGRQSSGGRGLMSIATKKFSPPRSHGGTFRFRLRANPVVTRDGKRRGLVRDDALSEWLRKKEDRIGASFRSVVAMDEGYVTGVRKKGEVADRVNIKTARFEGILEVADPDLFAMTLATGVGPAKSFGCGLLSLARA